MLSVISDGGYSNVITFNTRAVSLAGILAAIAGLLLDTSFQTSLLGLWPQFFWLPKALTLLGSIAAYYGRPYTVPDQKGNP